MFSESKGAPLCPPVRLALALAGTVCLAVLQRPETAALGAAAAWLLLLFSRPSWRCTVKRLALVNVFILFMWLTVPTTMPGEVLWRWGALSLSRPGVALMLLVTLKCNAMIMLLMALLADLDASTLGAALQRLHFPAKLAVLFLFAYRYIHVTAEQWRTLKTAAKLRGFAPHTNLHTYQTLGYMLGMTFVRGFERADRVHEAMLLRGFTGQFHSLADFRATKKDAVFAAVVLAALVALIAWDVYPELVYG